MIAIWFQGEPQTLLWSSEPHWGSDWESEEPWNELKEVVRDECDKEAAKDEGKEESKLYIRTNCGNCQEDKRSHSQVF